MNNAACGKVVTICVSITFFSLCLKALAQQPSSTTFTYQGTLTRFGAPVSGSYDFRFILRDASLNGNALGTNLVPQVLVSNGLFAATLDYGAGSFPGAPRYLEVGLRTNGSSGLYSILTPAQPVNPSPYAIQTISATSATVATNALAANTALSANTAANAQLLVGYDWSSILVSGNNPAQGQIAGNKIQTGGITSQQIGNGAVTASQLAPSAVTGAAIANSAVGSAQIAQGAVSNSQLATNAVALTNLVARQVSPNVGVGGIGLSQPCTNQLIPFSSGNWTSVSNLTVTIQTTGRPLWISLVPAVPDLSQGDSLSASWIYFTSTAPTGYAVAHVGVFDEQGLVLRIEGEGWNAIEYQPHSFAGIVSPPPAASLHTYQVKVFGLAAYPTNVRCVNVRLMVYEL